LLIIGHPGHELAVYGWLEQSRPEVMILTDGSGRTGVPRIAASLQIIAQAGARAGDLCGQLSDAALYRALLNHDHAIFIGLARRLADTLTRRECRYVVGDAGEGYNPTHDVCRFLIDAAIMIAGRRLRRPIGNYQFTLSGDPSRAHFVPDHDQAIMIRLDDAVWAAKTSVISRYAAEVGGTLLREVENLLGGHGADVLRTEYLVPVPNGGGEHLFASEPPYYESHGAQRVAEGHYRQAIRHEEHILPLARALRGLADHEA
jgi:hypothetical protein